MSFPKQISANQINKLASVGIHSLYDLITFFPMDNVTIKPFDTLFGEPEQKVKYLMEAQIMAVETRKSSFRPYFYITLACGNRRLNAFYFASSSWTLKSLIVGQDYQLLMTQSNGFWNIDKLTAVKEGIKANFVLGQATIKDYLSSRYHKRGVLTSPFFEQIHSQLNPEHYVLNLEGLIPEGFALPKILDLGLIHHPKSQTQYHIGMQNWTTFKVFLKISLTQYLDSKKLIKSARASSFDQGFLGSMTSKLPFELSISQVDTVIDLVRQISI